jgi:hypothetical protein
MCQIVWLYQRGFLRIATSQEHLTYTLGMKQHRHEGHDRLSMKFREVLLPQLHTQAKWYISFFRSSRKKFLTVGTVTVWGFAIVNWLQAAQCRVWIPASARPSLFNKSPAQPWNLASLLLNVLFSCWVIRLTTCLHLALTVRISVAKQPLYLHAFICVGRNFSC